MGWVVNATPRPLYTPRKRHGTHCIGGYVCSRADLDINKLTHKTYGNYEVATYIFFRFYF